MITVEQQNKIIAFIKPYKPSKIGLFGSYVRNENTANSDLDILVQFKETVNLLDLIGLEQELSDALGIKVDLVTEKSVHPEIKKYIDKDIKFILND